MTDPVQLPHEMKSRPRRGKILWFLVIPVTLCVLGAITFIRRAQSQKRLTATTQMLEVQSVSVVHAQPSPPETDLALPATPQAYSDSLIYARADGYVRRWYADIGAHVHQGQLRAVIDSPEVDKQLNQARAALVQAQATM